MQDNTEFFAGSVLVDDGIKFKTDMPIGKRQKTFIIKPLKPGTIVRISQLITKMKSIEESDQMIQEFLAKGTNLKIIAEIIALAVINSEILSKWKVKYYRWILLNGTKSVEQLSAYFNIVLRQTSAEQFFFIMAVTPAMNFLAKKKTGYSQQKAGTAFGEQSDLSKKHSD